MLELRPCCEHCALALPPDSEHAMICTFECTFCTQCVEKLQNVCPNCGGGFSPRPIRPATDWRGGNWLGQYPATTRVTHKPVDQETHAELVRALNGRPAHKR